MWNWTYTHSVKRVKQTCSIKYLLTLLLYSLVGLKLVCILQGELDTALALVQSSLTEAGDRGDLWYLLTLLLLVIFPDRSLAATLAARNVVRLGHHTDSRVIVLYITYQRNAFDMTSDALTIVEKHVTCSQQYTDNKVFWLTQITLYRDIT